MSEITVYWNPSKVLLRQEFIATGVQPATGHRKLSIDLVSLTPEQREVLIVQDGSLTDLTHEWRLLDEPSYSGEFLDQRDPITFDAVPTVEQVIALVGKRQAIKAEAKRREAEEDARRSEIMQRNLARVERANTEIAELEAAGDLEGLRHYTPGAMEPMPWVAFNHNPSYDVRPAIKRLEAAAFDAEMRRWAEAHGSEHLRKCLARDYRCDRIYVLERSACEAPGYVVDFYDHASWNKRSNPSHAALIAEAEAIELAKQIGAGGAGIYWLTGAPKDRPDDADQEDEGYDFEECEIVAILNYLGKYDLVKYI